MSENESPLRMMYQPDEYLCTWTVPDGNGGIVELPGNLDLRPNRAPRGTIYGSVPLQRDEVQIGVHMTSFPQIVEVPVLVGTLANGGSVALLDSSITYWSEGRGQIFGSAALLGQDRSLFSWSRSLETRQREMVSPLISSAKLQVTGLDAVLGAVPINSTKFPSATSESPASEWGAVLNPSTVGKWNREGVGLCVGFDGSLRARDAYEFRLTFSPVAEFTLSRSVVLRDLIDEFVEPLRRIISVSTGVAQELTYLTVRIEGRQGNYQVFGVGLQQEPFASSSERVRKQNSAIRAKLDDLSLLDMVLTWRRCSSEHHPLVETYGSMLHTGDQHPRSRFLLLIQALEGLYGYEHKDAYGERKSKHLIKREEIIKQLKGGIDSASMRFLKDYLMKNPPTSLGAILKDMIAGLSVDMMDRLKVTRLIEQVLADEESKITPFDALRIVRNNLAHGKRGYDAQDLHEVVSILELIVRGHSLRILGCPDRVVKRVFDDR